MATTKAYGADDYGKLLLRLMLGCLVFLHGLHKLMDIGGTVDGMTALLAAHHLPGFIAYGVYFGEVVGPILLVLGYFSRVGALLIAINMVVAISLVHVSMIFVRGDSGGWAIELQGVYLLTAIALILLGPGRLALNQR